MRRLFKMMFEFFFGFRDTNPAYVKKILEIERFSGKKTYQAYIEYRVFTRSVWLINMFDYRIANLHGLSGKYALSDVCGGHEFDSFQDAKKHLDEAIDGWINKEMQRTKRYRIYGIK